MKELDVFDRLVASGPFVECADKLMVYGQFVGSWGIHATWYWKDAGRREGKGERHFNWIIGGRGVQDVLFKSRAPSYEFSAMLRCYDNAIDAWHVTWM